MTAKADFLPSGDPHTHDLVLLEFTAKTPASATYDGGVPRELFRVAHPYPNHNGGMLGFNPLAAAPRPEVGPLYLRSAHGGRGRGPPSAEHPAELPSPHH